MAQQPGPGSATVSEDSPARRLVSIVPHTHWDREWYQPFQTFRMRLVETVDGLLDLMEGDPAFARFLLDGQMAAVDDYLELRPENEERIRRLAAAGRLTTGPWYVLMDEFLVSAETIVRNLQLGIERAAAFGGAMRVGYLPDMFGHIAQMPQILCQAGMSDAVVWRGVPSAISKSAFWWVSPDGSQVRAEYLLTGYSEGNSIGSDAKQLLRRITAYEEAHAGVLEGPILIMNGDDHVAPQPTLGRVVEEANGLQERFEVRISSLAEALAAASRQGLPRWEGELRTGARANLLMGVASNRVDVKQAAARTERALERCAEPLAALFLPPGRYPSQALALAWKQVIRNSAHDSICACSHDEVVSAVLARFAEARQIADAVAERALHALGESFAQPGTFAINPSSRPRSGTVELLLAGEGAIAGTQLVSERSGMDLQLVLSSAEVRAILGQIEGYQIAEDAFVTGVEITELEPEPGEDDVVLDVVVQVGPERRDDLPVDEIKRDLAARIALRPEGRIRVRLAHTASRRVLARIDDVQPYGWKRYQPAIVENPVSVAVEDSGDVSIGNGLTAVVVSAADGTFSLDGVPGLGRLVDGGDHGDTYNYSPPERDELVDTPLSTTLTVKESGPVRAVVEITRTYLWPERIEESSRSRVGEVPTTVLTTVELHAAEKLVRLSTSFHNAARDHRLRAHFPLEHPAGHSEAECAFAIVERGLEAEGGPSERPLATYPSRRFVRAGGLTVLHEGLLEYELVDIDPTSGKAGAVALTLLRATGMLSRLTMLNRPLPAGPTDSLEGPQLQGPRTVRYCLSTADVSPYELAEEAFAPLVAVPTFGGGHREDEGSALTVTGAEVSAVRRTAAGHLEVRVFNPSPTAGEAAVSLAGSAARGHVVDLLGRTVEPFEGSVALDAWRFATLRLVEG